MILLKSLKLNNFLSHEKTELVFKDGQKTLIDGNSGSGKSSIFESIIWALYGTGRSSNSSLVRIGQKKAEVILTLVEDKDVYEITRAVTAKGKHTLAVKVNGEAHAITGLKFLQEWIEKDLIGASYLLFVNSIAYLQGGADTFVTQTASKRKEMLLEIVKTDNFDDYYDQVKNLIKDKDRNHYFNTNEIEREGLWIKETKEKIAEKGVFEEKLASTKIEATKAHDEWSKLSVKQAESGTLDARIRAVDSILKDYQDDIRSTLKLLESSQEAEKTLLGLNALETTLRPLEEKKGALNALLQSGEKQASEKHSLLLKKPPYPGDEEEEALRHKPDCPSGDLCPYMGDKLTRLEAFKKARQDYEVWEAECLKLPKDIDIT
ncbi:MAG: AAA family ATPase, partial [Deltaproteobacteria bacterium]|nr:AAA family ATPase [Deltaproteobacteria bacterium]